MKNFAETYGITPKVASNISDKKKTIIAKPVTKQVVNQQPIVKPKVNLFDFSQKSTQEPNALQFIQNIPEKQPIQKPAQKESGFSIIPKASADSNEQKDLLQMYFDDPKQDSTGKEELSRALQEGVNPDELINHLKQNGYTGISTPVQQQKKEKSIFSKWLNPIGQVKEHVPGALEKTKEVFMGGLERVGEAGSILKKDKFALGEAGLTAIAGLGQSVLSPITGTIGEIGESAIEQIPQGFKDYIGTKVKPTIEDVKTWYNSQSNIQKKNLKGLGLSVETLSNFIGGKVASPAIQKTGTEIIKIGKQGARQTGKVVKQTINIPSKILKKSGEALYKTAIKPDVDEAGLILRSRAGLGVKPITRADTALRYGLAGTETQLGVQGIKKADEIFKKTIGPALDKSTIIHNIDDIFEKVKVNILKDKGGKLRQKELLEGLEALKDDYSTLGKNFTSKALQIEKSSLDNFTPQKIFKGKDVANGYNQVKNTFANVIRQQVRDDLGSLGIPNAKELYRDYANLNELSKIGIKGLTEGGLKGGFGTFWSTLYDKLAIPIKTVGGKTLYRAGEGLEFFGPKGIKKVGDYLDINKIKLDKNGNVYKTNTPKNANNMMGSNILSSSSNTGMGGNIVKQPLALPQGKKPAIITPQTIDRGIIQESKKGLAKTKIGTSGVNTGAENYKFAKQVIQDTDNINELKQLKSDIKELGLGKEKELLDELDSKIGGIEEINKIENISETVKREYGEDLIKSFQRLYGNEKKIIISKSGDKYSKVEFLKTPQAKDFSLSAQEYINQNPWGGETVQDLYDKLKETILKGNKSGGKYGKSGSINPGKIFEDIKNIGKGIKKAIINPNIGKARVEYEKLVKSGISPLKAQVEASKKYNVPAYKVGKAGTLGGESKIIKPVSKELEFSFDIDKYKKMSYEEQDLVNSNFYKSLNKNEKAYNDTFSNVLDDLSYEPQLHKKGLLLSLSPVEVHSIYYGYTEPNKGYYASINLGLRKGNELKGESKAIYDIMNKVIKEKLPNYDGVVYRGVNGYGNTRKLLENMIPGDTFLEKGFLSTSRSLEEAKNFSLEGGVIMKIKSKTGKDISVISSVSEEQEVLFPTNTKFKFLGKNNKGQYEIEEL